jgi:hypothetical protein
MIIVFLSSYMCLPSPFLQPPGAHEGEEEQGKKAR